MIILEEKNTGEQYELVSVYVAAKPYNAGYIRVVPYPNDMDLDPTVRPSYNFRVIRRPAMNGEFCREHDLGVLTISLAGLEY